MKRIRNLKNVFILAGICIFCSCSPKQIRKVTIIMDNACTLEQQTMAYEVIGKRMAVWGVKGKTDLFDGKFDLTYTIGKKHNSDSDTLLAQILTQRGEVYITEIYQPNEMKTLRKLPLNPYSVKNCNIKNNDSRQELFIDLNEEYAEEWARMTRDNVDRCLAIVMDGKVLMYPKVYSEIVGGKLVIAGHFDYNELALIKSIILGGVLDCKTQIIN